MDESHLSFTILNISTHQVRGNIEKINEKMGVWGKKIRVRDKSKAQMNKVSFKFF